MKRASQTTIAELKNMVKGSKVSTCGNIIYLINSIFNV